MNLPTNLTLKFGDSVVTCLSSQRDFLIAVAHIYQAFAVEQASEKFVPGKLDVSASGSAHAWRMNINEELIEFHDFDIALRAADDAIARQLLTASDGNLQVHGAAISQLDPTSSILLVGLSGSGKTTLSLELVKKGMTYLTDEYIVIEPCGCKVHPFPRAATRKFHSPTPPGQNLETPERNAFRSHYLPDDRANLKPVHLGKCTIVFPHFCPDMSPELRPLDAAEALAKIMPSTFGFDGRERKLWPALANLVTASRAFEFRYQNASIDINLLLNA